MIVFWPENSLVKFFYIRSKVFFLLFLIMINLLIKQLSNIEGLYFLMFQCIRPKKYILFHKNNPYQWLQKIKIMDNSHKLP